MISSLPVSSLLVYSHRDGEHREGKLHFKKKGGGKTKTKERDNNQLPMMFSKA